MSAGFVIFNARILTLSPSAGEPLEARRGDRMRDLGTLDPGYIEVNGSGMVVGLGTHTCSEPWQPSRKRIDAKGRVVLPTWVDCHTHACFAGDRSREWQMKFGGADYLQILASGGGIMSTVRSVREADAGPLQELLLTRLRAMFRLGTGLAEVKSGYGLDTASELKMLRAIAASTAAMATVPTFLGAHAKDPAQPDFVDRTIKETLPAVAAEFPGICCDAFCEEGAWSLAECLRYFHAAADLGLPLRVHADQFHSLGMVPAAIELGALSVDHLEATSAGDLARLAKSQTMGVALPCTPFSLGTPQMRAREFLDLGGALAIASNFNPGSAPSPSVPFSLYLALRFMSLCVEEVICAATWNAACVLKRQGEHGCLSVGRRASLQLLQETDERAHLLAIAGPGPDLVYRGDGNFALGGDPQAIAAVSSGMAPLNGG